MWLFDTVALSESFKRQPNPGFVAWLGGELGEQIHTSVLCLGEIRRGVELLPAGARQTAMTHWLEVDLPARLAGRIHPVDEPAAQTWGRLSALRTLPVADSLIAATALVHGLTVVTRNTRDFDGLGVPVLNPWI